MLNLFTVVQWGAGTCIAPSGEAGNCLPPGECQFRQGIPGGPCAGGYGTCCVCELQLEGNHYRRVLKRY